MIPLHLVRTALRSCGRFRVMTTGERVMIGATSSGDLVAWTA